MKPLYVYSTYWSTWSRVIVRETEGSVFLKLTPINAHSDYGQWAETAQEMLSMQHYGKAYAISGKNYLVTCNLPTKVLNQMKEHCDSALIERMLTYDYSQEVDITCKNVRAAQDKTNGGGIPLKIMREILSGSRTFWHNK